MSRRALCVGSLSIVSLVAQAQPCALPPGFDDRYRSESNDFVVRFRPSGSTIDVGQLFAIDIVVCPKKADPGALALTFDATMPEHRHGMNYRPTIKALGGNRYRADGLMFHMPGRWQLVFDIADGKRRERLTADLVVQ